MNLKIFLVLLLASASVSSGCSQTDSSNTLHFLLWKPHQPKPLEEVITQFERENPDLRVERHMASENASEYYRVLSTKLRNSDPELDVFFMDVIWPPEFVARNYLDDLTPRFPPSDQKDFFPGPIAASTFDGRIFAVPFNIDVGLLFYRKDLLNKHGFSAPSTWTEMLDQIDTIIKSEGTKNPNLTGYVGQFEKYEGLVCNILEFIGGHGGEFLDSENLPAINTPNVIKAVQFIRDELIHNKTHPRRASDYLLTAKEQQSREIFARGDAIFLRNWPETWGILNDSSRSSVQGQVGMSPLPHFEGWKSVGTLGGWQLGIASHSKKKDAAWRFISFMTSHDIQKKLALSRSQTMARLTIYGDPDLLERLPHFGLSGPWGSPLKSAALGATPRPRSVRYNAVSERIQRCFHDAIRDPDSDIPGLMADCSEQIRREMDLGESG